MGFYLGGEPADQYVDVEVDIWGTEHNVYDCKNEGEKLTLKISYGKPVLEFTTKRYHGMLSSGHLTWVNSNTTDWPILSFSGTWQGNQSGYGANSGPTNVIILNRDNVILRDAPPATVHWTQGQPYWQWELAFEGSWKEKAGPNGEISVTATIKPTEHNVETEPSHSLTTVDISTKTPRQEFRLDHVVDQSENTGVGEHALKSDGVLHWVNSDAPDEEPIVTFSGRWQGSGANSGPTNVIVVNGFPKSDA